MKKTLNGILIFAILSVFVSCVFIPFVKVDVEFDYDRFKQEKSLWKSLKPANYQFKLDYWNNGFSFPVNTLIIVENGVYKTQIPYSEEDGFSYESYLNETITDIYDNIEREYKEYHKNRLGFFDSYLREITIEYDTVNHIPVEVIKYYYVPPMLMDSPSYSEMKITEYREIAICYDTENHTPVEAEMYYQFR
jgi:hypothetical protein